MLVMKEVSIPYRHIKNVVASLTMTEYRLSFNPLQAHKKHFFDSSEELNDFSFNPLQAHKKPYFMSWDYFYIGMFQSPIGT